MPTPRTRHPWLGYSLCVGFPEALRSETLRHENDDYEADDEAMKHDEVDGKTLKSSKSVGTEYLVSSIPNEHF